MPAKLLVKMVSQLSIFTVSLLLVIGRYMSLAATSSPPSCSTYDVLYRQVNDDFKFWDSSGISRELMQETVRLFAAPYKRGIHYGFIGGKAYVLTPNHLGRYGQDILSRQLAYMNVLLDLEKRFGHLIPDCEFVIVTTDTPNQAPVVNSTAGGSDRTDSSGAVGAAASGRKLLQAQGPAGGGSGSQIVSFDHIYGIPGLPKGSYPILRASKSDAFPADILIPSHDFYLLRYDATVLNASTRLEQEMPWSSRLLKAYAQYDMHVARHRNPSDPFTFRHGVDEMPICNGMGSDICTVRQHFLGIAQAAHSPLLDIRHAAAPSGVEHYRLMDLHTPRAVALAAARAAALAEAKATTAQRGSAAADPAVLALIYGEDGIDDAEKGLGSYRYTSGGSATADGSQLPGYLWEAARHRLLVHLDGRGISSSLERLLALGSVVLAEQSGYYGYFHRALQPYVHYIPWWERSPAEVFDKIEWVKQHEAEAAKIAATGSAFARRFLTAEGRACYWLRVLSRLGATLRYTPQLEHFPRALPVARFRDEYLIRTRPARGQRPLFGQPFEP